VKCGSQFGGACPGCNLEENLDARGMPHHWMAWLRVSPSDPGQGTISSAKYHQKYPPM
jgi:hypothetical protein